MTFKEFLHELRCSMSNKRNSVAQQMEADAYTRQQLLDTLRKNMEADQILSITNHKAYYRNTPTRIAKPFTVSREYYETLERLGASQKLLNNLKPIVRD